MLFLFAESVVSMDDDGLNMRNWGYYEPSFKEHFGLQLLSPLGDHKDAKSFVSSRENPFMINPNATATATAYHHQPSLPMHYIRDSWIQRERLLHIIPGSPNLALLQDDLGSNSAQVMQPIEPLNDPEMNVDDSGGGDGGGGRSGALKKRSVAAATTRGKKPKKVKENRKPPGGRSKVVKWNLDVVINGVDMDISGIPIPVCSCTGTPQQCYRWGSGGWQSACCTTTISMYPLPMSTKRRGARIAGRKMSQGAFKKVLEKLGSEGYDFSNAIDLRAHWAKHGTNKFVTIR